MEMLIDNPQITIEKLNALEKGVENNTASTGDYEELSKFLSRLNMENYILNKMRERGFVNYQEFINYRNKPAIQKTLSFDEGVILGIIKQCIYMLKTSFNV